MQRSDGVWEEQNGASLSRCPPNIFVYFELTGHDPTADTLPAAEGKQAGETEMAARSGGINIYNI